MDNPSVESLMDTVRKINQIAKSARSAPPDAEDYLRAISADPYTQWFTELLQEKNEELRSEQQKAEWLACTLQAWYEAKQAGRQSGDEADLQLVSILHELQIIQR